jgi:hypothetical protein
LKNNPREEVAMMFMKHTERGNTPVSSDLANRFPNKHNLLTNSTIEMTAYMISTVLFRHLVAMALPIITMVPRPTEANRKRKENETI